MAELVRLTFGDTSSRGYFERNFVNKCVEEALTTLRLVQMGAHDLTTLETLAIRLIVESSLFWCGGDLSKLPLANADEGEWIYKDGKVVRGEDNDEHESAL